MAGRRPNAKRVTKVLVTNRGEIAVRRVNCEVGQQVAFGELLVVITAERTPGEGSA
jgi:acetyl/propionyl-CoA carboxylase alpha subunit